MAVPVRRNRPGQGGITPSPSPVGPPQPVGGDVGNGASYVGPPIQQPPGEGGPPNPSPFPAWPGMRGLREHLGDGFQSWLDSHGLTDNYNRIQQQWQQNHPNGVWNSSGHPGFLGPPVQQPPTSPGAGAGYVGPPTINPINSIPLPGKLGGASYVGPPETKPPGRVGGPFNPPRPVNPRLGGGQGWKAQRLRQQQNDNNPLSGLANNTQTQNRKKNR